MSESQINKANALDGRDDDGIVDERIDIPIEPIGLGDVNTSTRLLDKHYSPLIVRKYQMEGWPLFVGIICDVSLSDLDDVVWEFAENYHSTKKDDIQWARNFCGALTEELCSKYGGKKRGSGEGFAVLWYIDKCFISSLWGDFMTHKSCKEELFFIINTLPHI